jgi:hypothetical protein
MSDKRPLHLSDPIALLANISQILSFVFSIIATYALVSQPTPLKIPGTDFELDTSFQVVFILCTLLAYLQFVKNHIFNRRLKEGWITTHGYSYYPLTFDLVTKRLYLIIPLVILFFFYDKIDPWMSLGTFISMIVFIGLLELTGSWEYEVFYATQALSWNVNEELKNRWVARIRNKIVIDGEVHTGSFPDIGLSLVQQKDKGLTLKKKQ